MLLGAVAAMTERPQGIRRMDTAVGHATSQQRTLHWPVATTVAVAATANTTECLNGALHSPRDLSRKAVSVSYDPVPRAKNKRGYRRASSSSSTSGRQKVPRATAQSSSTVATALAATIMGMTPAVGWATARVTTFVAAAEGRGASPRLSANTNASDAAEDYGSNSHPTGLHGPFGSLAPPPLEQGCYSPGAVVALSEAHTALGCRHQATPMLSLAPLHATGEFRGVATAEWTARQKTSQIATEGKHANDHRSAAKDLGRGGWDWRNVAAESVAPLRCGPVAVGPRDCIVISDAVVENREASEAPSTYDGHQLYQGRTAPSANVAPVPPRVLHSPDRIVRCAPSEALPSPLNDPPWGPRLFRCGGGGSWGSGRGVFSSGSPVHSIVAVAAKPPMVAEDHGGPELHHGDGDEMILLWKLRSTANAAVDGAAGRTATRCWRPWPAGTVAAVAADCVASVAPSAALLERVRQGSLPTTPGLWANAHVAADGAPSDALPTTPPTSRHTQRPQLVQGLTKRVGAPPCSQLCVESLMQLARFHPSSAPPASTSGETFAGGSHAPLAPVTMPTSRRLAYRRSRDSGVARSSSGESASDAIGCLGQSALARRQQAAWGASPRTSRFLRGPTSVDTCARPAAVLADSAGGFPPPRRGDLEHGVDAGHPPLVTVQSWRERLFGVVPAVAPPSQPDLSVLVPMYRNAPSPLPPPPRSTERSRAVFVREPRDEVDAALQMGHEARLRLKWDTRRALLAANAALESEWPTVDADTAAKHHDHHDDGGGTAPGGVPLAEPGTLDGDDDTIDLRLDPMAAA